MSFFKAGRHSSTETSEECPKCGAMGISGQRCPNPRCGHELGPNVGQVFLDPLLDVGRTAKRAFGGSSNTKTGSSSGSSGKGKLIALGVLAAAVAFYIAKFTGDFEARGNAVIGHAEASRESPQCGKAMSDGDNLTCFDGADGCTTSDEVDGRWVKVERGDEKCWVSYADVKFQRGIFMSLVGRVFDLKTTDEENAKSVASYADALSKKAPELRTSGKWEELARIAARVDGKGLTITSDAQAALQEGVERIHYTNLLKDSKEALSVGEELKLLVEAESLKYPTDKQDVVSRRKKAEEKFFGNEIVSLIKDAKDAKGNLGLIVDRLINLVGFGAPSDKSAIGGPLAIVAKRLRTAARTKPDDVIMAANKSRESEALLRSTGAARVAITADLSAAWETAWGMKMNTSIAKASRMLASKPKDAYGLVCQARSAAGPTDKRAIEHLATRLNTIMGAQATVRARSYLQAIADRKWPAVRNFELPFAHPGAPTGAEWVTAKDAWVDANPGVDGKGKKIGKVTTTVKDCGAKVEAIFEVSGGADMEPTKVMVALCPSDKGIWFPCAAPTPLP